jgi:hypothetical protein
MKHLLNERLTVREIPCSGCGYDSAARTALSEALDAIERVRKLADLDDDLVKNAQRAFDNDPTGFEGDGYESMRAALKILADSIIAALEGDPE